MNHKVFGCFEYVTLPEFGVESVLAKIDTGAYSGALNCETVKVIKKSDGSKVLRFVLPENPDKPFEATSYIRTYVRSASGHRQVRYIINTKIVINDKTYPISIGLSNRSKMKRAVLIGRRFLRENNALVDVTVNQELDDEGEASQ